MALKLLNIEMGSVDMQMEFWRLSEITGLASLKGREWRGLITRTNDLTLQHLSLTLKSRFNYRGCLRAGIFLEGNRIVG